MAVKYSSEWWAQQPGAPDLSHIKPAEPGTIFKTPFQQSTVTSKGSEYRPYTGTSNYASPSAPDGFSKVKSENGTWSWLGPGGGAGDPADTYNPWSPTTSGGGSGYGGGYSGPRIDGAAIMAQLSKYRPQKYSWTDIALPDYKPPAFYGFDDSTYTMMRDRIAEGIANARTRGGAAIGEARQQMAGIPLAFQAMPTTSDPGMSAAMQRMFEANNVPTALNQRTMNEGVQADQAFGNLYSILGANERQMRSSRDIALTGDERRFGEELDQTGLVLNTSVDLALAQAKDQHRIDEWLYDKETADRNFEISVQEILANAAGKQETANANVGLVNDANQAANSTIIDLLAQGIAVDPSAYTAVT